MAGLPLRSRLLTRPSSEPLAPTMRQTCTVCHRRRRCHRRRGNSNSCSPRQKESETGIQRLFVLQRYSIKHGWFLDGPTRAVSRRLAALRKLVDPPHAFHPRQRQHEGDGGCVWLWCCRPLPRASQSGAAPPTPRRNRLPSLCPSSPGTLACQSSAQRFAHVDCSRTSPARLTCPNVLRKAVFRLPC